MKKSQASFEKWALPLLKKIQAVTLQQDHTLTLEYRQTLGSGSSYMECACVYPYKSISIRYGDKALKDWEEGDKEELFKGLVHEMCHPLTDPLYFTGFQRFITKDQMEYERERLTDHIANIVIAHKLVE